MRCLEIVLFIVLDDFIKRGHQSDECLVNGMSWNPVKSFWYCHNHLFKVGCRNFFREQLIALKSPRSKTFVLGD